MDLFDKIFIYCERGQDPTFWAEPWNAVTNGAFIIAAAVALAMWLRMPHTERRFIDFVMILLIFTIGTGSFLFHTHATRWASLADVIPIGLFMLAAVGHALKRYFGFGWLLTGFGLSVFIAALWISGEVRCNGGPCFNGSLGYAPALITLFLLGGVLIWRRHPAGSSLLLAGIVFAISLTARSIDMAVCPATVVQGSDPYGTHFLWHILNAVVLFLVVRAALRHGGGPMAEASKTTG